MTKIAVVGAGQAGTQLALILQTYGYSITLLSDRSPEDVSHGNVMSTQCMFHSALETERHYGFDLWRAEAPLIETTAVQIAGPNGQPALRFAGALDQPAQAVDQRLKLPTWMRIFEERGGELIITKATIDTLEQLTQEYDLVIVATGKGELGRVFKTNARESPYKTPQRMLSLVSVQNVVQPQLEFTIIPEVGEFIAIPGLTSAGPSHFLLTEGIIGGPLDCWSNIKTPQAQLERMQECIKTYVPWQTEIYAQATLTDEKGVLKGAFAPTVRHPVGQLPSGRVVLGLGDAIITNDPISGQGSNTAAKAAEHYAMAILNHEGDSFNRDWMQRTFDSFWTYAQAVTYWTNELLQPPAEHVVSYFAAATLVPALADRFVNGFDHPPHFFPWFADPILTSQVLAEASQQLQLV